MRLAANRPAEERGQSRDGVRMLVATTDGLAHAMFADLPRFLCPGDLLVVNTSATLPAAVDAYRADGRAVLIATHDINQARRSDRVLCLNHRQTAFGPPDEALSAAALEATYGGELIVLPGGERAVTVQHHGHDA